MRSGPIVISIVNHKGGVLKTTSTVNLGAALVEHGKRVLLVDMDMQQNLSTYLLGRRQYDPDAFTLFDAIRTKSSLDPLVAETHVPGLFIVACDEDFIEMDLTLVSVSAREQALRRCLKKSAGVQAFDFVLLDCPPGMSLTTVNALAASDYFLVPCEASYLPIQGLEQLGQIVEQQLRDVAPDLALIGVTMTKYHQQHKICRQADKAVREKLGDFVTAARIRVNTKAASAPSRQQTIIEYEGSDTGRGTEDYRALASEVLERVVELEAERGRLVANG